MLYLPRSVYAGLLLSFFLFVAACSARDEMPPPVPVTVEDFPLETGTIWVYDYEAYAQAQGDPTQVITATYTMTETVVTNTKKAPYHIVEVQRLFHLTSPEPSPLQLPAERVWYFVVGNKVYESRRWPGLSGFEPESASLAFDFPLTVGKQWCSGHDEGRREAASEAVPCIFQRTVTEGGAYRSPAGQYEHCVHVTEAANSGGVRTWLCDGVGIVEAAYNHDGTRFGFRQRLLSFSPPIH